MTSIPLGLRYMAAGAFFFSLMSLLVKVAGQRLPSQEVVLLRGFVALLLCIAVFPLIHRLEHFWEKNSNKLWIALGLAALTVAYYAFIHGGFQSHGHLVTGGEAVKAVLKHAVEVRAQAQPPVAGPWGR